MKPKLLLRIAAILIFIHGVLHTLGASGWKQATDKVQQLVIVQMTGHQFPFMGAIHSFADFYDGFIYSCSIALFLIAIILWMISGETLASPLAKKITLALSIALLLWGVDELLFFFPLASGMTLLASLCSFAAFFKSKAPSPQPQKND